VSTSVPPNRISAGSLSSLGRETYGSGSKEASPVHGWAWMVIAAAMLIIAGTLGFVEGLTALGRAKFFVPDAEFAFGNLRMWGWIIVTIGWLTALAGIGVTMRSGLACWVGIALAGSQGVLQMTMVQAYPVWSVCIFAVDLLAICALAMHEGSRRSAAALS
jgi:hypothetical protein